MCLHVAQLLHVCWHVCCIFVQRQYHYLLPIRWLAEPYAIEPVLAFFTADADNIAASDAMPAAAKARMHVRTHARACTRKHACARTRTHAQPHVRRHALVRMDSHASRGMNGRSCSSG